MQRLLVNIDVDDLEAAGRFYCAAFGLRAGRRFGPHGLELLGAEAPLYLLVKPAGTAPAPGVQAPRSYRPHWTPVHLDFAVDDLEAACARAQAAGATLEAGIEAQAWGRIAMHP
jgi:catechol 2,3-dioxygenase-like lactoylglutathione lyase family enzyme